MASHRLIGATAVAVALSGLAAEASSASPAPIGALLLDWLVGAAFAAAAFSLAAHDRVTALLCLAVSILWYLGTATLGISALSWAGPAVALLYRAPLLHLLSRSVCSRTGTPLGILAYLSAAAPAALAVPGTIGVAGLLAVTHLWNRGNAAARQRGAARWSAVGALCLAGAWTLPAIAPLPPSGVPLVLDATMIAVALLAGRVFGPAERLDTITELLIDLGPYSRRSGPVSSALGTALAQADPLVLYQTTHDPSATIWVDEFGRAHSPPSPSALVTTAPDGTTVALELDDPEAVEAGLAEAAAKAAGLALHGTRLAAELRHKAASSRQARDRLLAVGDMERKQLEHRLQDGPVHRLLEVREGLRRVHSAGAARLAAELETTIAELRALAEGLYPALLVQQPLTTALVALAGRTGNRASVTVEGDPDQLDPLIRAFVYFTSAECLANISHHAPEASVVIWVDAAEQALELVIEDDGPGGADPRSGRGLTGLVDRAAALGGELRVDSPAGGPTRIRARIPLDRGGLEAG